MTTIVTMLTRVTTNLDLIFNVATMTVVSIIPNNDARFLFCFIVGSIYRNQRDSR